PPSRWSPRASWPASLPGAVTRCWSCWRCMPRPTSRCFSTGRAAAPRIEPIPKTTNTTGPADVEAYLQQQTTDNRAAPEGLRRRVTTLLPEASEAISYGMPALRYKDRYAVSYAGWAKHCSFYPLTAAAANAHAAELEGLSIDKGTVRFVPPQRLSDTLLRAIV